MPEPHSESVSDTSTTSAHPTTVRGETLSVMRAAALVGVSRRTLYNWMDSGKIQYVRTAGGSRRIITASLFRDGNVPCR